MTAIAPDMTSWRLDGRVCLITGATAGIGRATALLLASLGAELVLVGRSRRRMHTTLADIKRANPGTKVTGMIADFSSQADVRRLAEQVLLDVPRLHVLINNAAVVTMQREETVDGIERQLAVNHLASFLLTNLLLDRLLANTPSRVVMVASQVERSGSIDLADLQRVSCYDGNGAYCQSKLANILFTAELARRVENRNLTLISLHPGVYTTRLLDTLLGWSPIVTRLRGRGLPGPEVGAAVLARAAADPALEGRGLVHLHEHAVAAPSAQARDMMLAKALWEESARLTGISMT